MVKAVLPGGLNVEAAPGIEGSVHLSELDVTFNPDLRCWQPGDTMDVKLLEVGSRPLFASSLSPCCSMSVPKCDMLEARK